MRGMRRSARMRRGGRRPAHRASLPLHLALVLDRFFLLLLRRRQHDHPRFDEVLLNLLERPEVRQDRKQDDMHDDRNRDDPAEQRVLPAPASHPAWSVAMAKRVMPALRASSIAPTTVP